MACLAGLHGPRMFEWHGCSSAPQRRKDALCKACWQASDAAPEKHLAGADSYHRGVSPMEGSVMKGTKQAAGSWSSTHISPRALAVAAEMMAEYGRDALQIARERLQAGYRGGHDTDLYFAVCLSIIDTEHPCVGRHH